MSIRVLIADDQAMIRRSFRVLLESEPGIEVVGDAEDGVQAVALARRRQADVVLMDAGFLLKDAQRRRRAERRRRTRRGRTW